RRDRVAHVALRDVLACARGRFAAETPREEVEQRLFVEAGHWRSGTSMLDVMREGVDDVLEKALGPWASPRVKERWRAHVAAIAGEDDPRTLALEDVALALAAALGEANAVAEIEKTIIEPLPRTLSRLRPTPELVDELRQELR